jgi:simple sugar transport system substrate-binding protein
MKFRTVIIVLGVVLVSLLQPVQAAQYTIVTILPAEQSPLFERAQSGVRRFAETTGHQATVRAPTTTDAAQQIQIVAEAIAQHVNAICIVPVSADVDAILQQARAQGIVVVGHNTFDVQSVQYRLEPFEDEAYGVHLMTALAARMPSAGEYAMLLGSRANLAEVRWFDAALAAQKAQFPNLKLVTRGLEEYHDASIAARKTRELFRAFPGLQGLLCLSDTATQGAVQVLADTGRQAQVVVVGTGLTVELPSAITGNNRFLISSWEPADLGYALNALAARLLDGETVHEGMSLNITGYESLVLRGNTLYGSAWTDVMP